MRDAERVGTMGEQDARVWRGEHCWASRGRPGFRGSYWVARPEFLTMGVDVVEPIHHARRWKLRDVPPGFFPRPRASQWQMALMGLLLVVVAISVAGVGGCHSSASAPQSQQE